jgi:hypothetical protein
MSAYIKAQKELSEVRAKIASLMERKRPLSDAMIVRLGNLECREAELLYDLTGSEHPVSFTCGDCGKRFRRGDEGDNEKFCLRCERIALLEGQGESGYDLMDQNESD